MRNCAIGESLALPGLDSTKEVKPPRKICVAVVAVVLALAVAAISHIVPLHFGAFPTGHTAGLRVEGACGPIMYCSVPLRPTSPGSHLHTAIGVHTATPSRSSSAAGRVDSALWQCGFD